MSIYVYKKSDNYYFIGTGRRHYVRTYVHNDALMVTLISRDFQGDYGSASDSESKHDSSQSGQAKSSDNQICLTLNRVRNSFSDVMLS